MRDIISFHIGQAGIQIGSSLWELLCLEHNINETGKYNGNPRIMGENIETFFIRCNNGKFVPRSLFIDLESSVIEPDIDLLNCSLIPKSSYRIEYVEPIDANEIRIGSYRGLYHPNRLISGPEDASSNFARGFFTIGKLLLLKINQELRRLFEASNYVQGFMMFRSLGGGTGSGLTSAIFDVLSEFPKIAKIEIPIYPCPTLSTSTVEPYNSIIAEHFCIEDVDVGLLFDNEALYDICTHYLSINSPSFNSINRLVAQVCSSITASMRFENVLSCELTVLSTNLVPYPRIHFPLCNFSPVAPVEKTSCQSLSIRELTRTVFERSNQMLKIDTTYGRYMSCALFYRGPISPKEIYSALLEIKQSKAIEFVEWCPTGFKVGINNSLPVVVPSSKIAKTNRNVSMLTNSSAVGQAWQRLCHKFYLLYSKRSFLHWFVGEGMDECEFTEALYNMSTLVKDYEEVGMDSPKLPSEAKNQSNVLQRNQNSAVYERQRSLSAMAMCSCQRCNLTKSSCF